MFVNPFCVFFAKGKEDGGFELSVKTVKNIHGIFHKALKQAVILGYLKFNPSEACTLPRMTKQVNKTFGRKVDCCFY